MARLRPNASHPHLHHHLLHLLLLTLLPAPSLSEGEEEVARVSVEKAIVAVEEGHQVQIACSRPDNTTAPLSWSFHNGSAIPLQDPSQRIWANSTTGELTIKESRLGDSGNLTCSVSGSAGSAASVDVHVYAMPGYEEEGVIIGAVSAAMLAVLVLGFLIQRRSRSKSRSDSKARLRGKTEQREQHTENTGNVPRPEHSEQPQA